ncbi:hypothetical protein GCM10010271_37930 [Streptomyces kurssanovii]|nr:hypothetical protein GCM10010271_37930 [Streptomyces kurssanovii]
MDHGDVRIVAEAALEEANAGLAHLRYRDLRTGGKEMIGEGPVAGSQFEYSASPVLIDDLPHESVQAGDESAPDLVMANMRRAPGVVVPEAVLTLLQLPHRGLGVSCRHEESP